MKYGILIVVLLAASFLLYGYVRIPQPAPNQPNSEKTMAQSTMKLKSPAFEPGGLIPSQYTCDGANKHIPLDFEGVPAEAKSLILIMEDPDVSKGSVPDDVFDHWVVFNIPPKTVGAKEVEETVPGTYGNNSAGQPSYTGPCPPEGEHRYFFRLYALDTQLALKKGAAKKEVLESMEGHVIGQTELMARYVRQGRPQ